MVLDKRMRAAAGRSRVPTHARKTTAAHGWGTQSSQLRGDEAVGGSGIQSCGPRDAFTTFPLRRWYPEGDLRLGRAAGCVC
jgi:hypothetical protein